MLTFPKQEYFPIQMSLTTSADELLFEANSRLDRKRKSLMGQFMTPSVVGRFMASLFRDFSGVVELLDAGAGIGSLTAAVVERCCGQNQKPSTIKATTYELEPVLLPYLQNMLGVCGVTCREAGIDFTYDIHALDFIQAGRDFFGEDLFIPRDKIPKFSHVILNPPYKKIPSSSEHRKWLHCIGVETVNLYAAFVAVAIKMLRPGGEMVAITPRSFCNGPYFKPFRHFLLNNSALTRIHVFESRNKAFAHDDVLQENIIFHLVKGEPQKEVFISVTQDSDFKNTASSRYAAFNQVVKPKERDLVIHVTASERDISIGQRMKTLPCSLQDLNVEVSTGPVVDFRMRDYLRMRPQSDCSPLIYPIHCSQGFVSWPSEGRKPNSIINTSETLKWLFPNGYYTLVRRFSSKEEKRRIVAAVHDPGKVPGENIGFENHLNLFHFRRKGISSELARGLALFLNSTFVDDYFRQFSGHTQVNAADLRMLRYPRKKTLETMGTTIGNTFPCLQEIDLLFEKVLVDESEEFQTA